MTAWRTALRCAAQDVYGHHLTLRMASTDFGDSTPGVHVCVEKRTLVSSATAGEHGDMANLNWRRAGDEYRWARADPRPPGHDDTGDRPDAEPVLDVRARREKRAANGHQCSAKAKNRAGRIQNRKQR